MQDADDLLPIDPDTAAIGLDQADDGLEQHRLATARRPAQRHQLAFADVEIDVLENVESVKPLVYARQRDHAGGEEPGVIAILRFVDILATMPNLPQNTSHVKEKTFHNRGQY